MAKWLRTIITDCLPADAHIHCRSRGILRQVDSRRFPSHTASDTSMRITKPQIEHSGDLTTYKVSVETRTGANMLWYRVEGAHGHLLDDTTDAAVVALLLPAMATGEDLRIDGMVSARLLENLPELQRVLKQIIPPLRVVQFHAEAVHYGQPRPTAGVATGFSGGVDSFCTLADYFYDHPPGPGRITHLLFNNVGSHEAGGESLFRRRYRRLLPVASRMGLPLLVVNSNLDAFYGRRLSFQQTHTLRNASVALLLQRGLSSWLYASGIPDQDAFVGPAPDLSYSDSVTLPLLSTETLHTASVGGCYSRVEKTQHIADVQDSFDSLDVCVSPYHDGIPTNCSACFKCLRTLATLEIGGLLDRYARVFDRARYRRLRDGYLAGLSTSEDPCAKEVVRFAEQRQLALPVNSLWRSIRFQVLRRWNSVHDRLLGPLKHRRRARALRGAA